MLVFNFNTNIENNIEQQSRHLVSLLRDKTQKIYNNAEFRLYAKDFGIYPLGINLHEWGITTKCEHAFVMRERLLCTWNGSMFKLLSPGKERVVTAKDIIETEGLRLCIPNYHFIHVGMYHGYLVCIFNDNTALFFDVDSLLSDCGIALCIKHKKRKMFNTSHLRIDVSDEAKYFINVYGEYYNLSVSHILYINNEILITHEDIHTGFSEIGCSSISFKHNYTLIDKFKILITAEHISCKYINGYLVLVLYRAEGCIVWILQYIHPYIIIVAKRILSDMSPEILLEALFSDINGNIEYISDTDGNIIIYNNACRLTLKK